MVKHQLAIRNRAARIGRASFADFQTEKTRLVRGICGRDRTTCSVIVLQNLISGNVLLAEVNGEQRRVCTITGFDQQFGKD